ncbi:MAG: GDP-mannose 4,6-dehydratase [Candidatus Omnitrophica bacterium]|nr:GDP-mannose 4,6-dehydratase [Candidatus Omnitrophota bacterium]
MKSLVTGAAGFIGSHLMESLVADGIATRAFVRAGSDISSIANLRTEIAYGDVRDIQSLKNALGGVDIVYHLAAVSRYDLNVPTEEYKSTNVIGTRNVLEACRVARVKRVIYTSTIEALGPSVNGKTLTEETEPIPRNIYGKSKLDGEAIVNKYHTDHRMDTIIVRPPMTYGPRDMVLFRRLFKLISKGYYPVVGNGKTLTEFCYVKNQVFGIRLAAEKGRPGETYFISDERPYPIEEIVRRIASELDVRIRIVHLSIPVALAIGFSLEFLSKIFRFYPFVIKETGRPPFSRKTVEWTSKSSLFCDTSKAKKELNYKPPYSLDEGIRETITWYKEKGLL